MSPGESAPATVQDASAAHQSRPTRRPPIRSPRDQPRPPAGPYPPPRPPYRHLVRHRRPTPRAQQAAVAAASAHRSSSCRRRRQPARGRSDVALTPSPVPAGTSSSSSTRTNVARLARSRPRSRAGPRALARGQRVEQHDRAIADARSTPSTTRARSPGRPGRAPSPRRTTCHRRCDTRRSDRRPCTRVVIVPPRTGSGTTAAGRRRWSRE